MLFKIALILALSAGTARAEDEAVIEPVPMPSLSVVPATPSPEPASAAPAIVSLGTFRVVDIKDNVADEDRFVSQCRNLRRGAEPAEDCGSLVWAVRAADQIALFDADAAIAEMRDRPDGLPTELESFGIGGPNCRETISLEDARTVLLASQFCRAFKRSQRQINMTRLLRRRLTAKALRANDIFYFDEGMDMISSAITTVATAFMMFGANTTAVRVIVPKKTDRPEKIRVMNYLQSSGLAFFMIPYSFKIEHDFYLERVGD